MECVSFDAFTGYYRIKKRFRRNYLRYFIKMLPLMEYSGLAVYIPNQS